MCEWHRVSILHDCVWPLKAFAALLQATKRACTGALVQEVAPTCFSLLHTIADGLSQCSAAVSRAVEQLQRSDDEQLSVQLVNKASELRHCGFWLPAAACDLLHCMRERFVYWAVDTRQLLITLGHLVQRVRANLGVPLLSFCCWNERGLAGACRHPLLFRPAKPLRAT
jgi:hypothetical protein